MRIPLAALGPVARRRRLGILLPLLALAAVVAGVLVGRGGPDVDRAAAFAPPDAALYVRADREGLDALERFPSFRALGIGEDVEPWLGDELALAYPPALDAPLIIASVRDRAAAERYRDGLPEGTASAFAGDYLVIGRPEAVERAGDGASLADSAVFRRASGAVDDAPVELYAPAAGIRRLLEGAPDVVRALAVFAESPHLEGLAAAATPQPRGIAVSARVLRAPDAPPAREFAPVLTGRAPATAAAYLAAPGADVLLSMLERGGISLDAVRAALPELAGIDLDRDLLGPLAAEAAATLTARGATPVVTVTARSTEPPLTREALARLQGPLAELLGRETPGFQAAGPNAYTLAATDRLRPSYALDGDVLIASTDESGLEQRTLARRGLAQELALRSVAEDTSGRIEALAFADLRQLLALGERTGLSLGPGFPATRDDLRQVRAAGAVVRREESDSTVELFLQIP